jgi:hypothetical protein
MDAPARGVNSGTPLRILPAGTSDRSACLAKVDSIFRMLLCCAAASAFAAANTSASMLKVVRMHISYITASIIAHHTPIDFPPSRQSLVQYEMSLKGWRISNMK